MSINTILIQVVFFSCVLILLRSRQIPRGWLIAVGGVLVVLGVSFLLIPAQAGWVSGGLWLLLILLPLLGTARVGALVAQERFRDAQRLAYWVRWLHPADGMVEYPAVLRGLELGQQGRLDEALQIFNRYSTTTHPMGQTAIVLLYRMDARWHTLITWVQQQFPGAKALSNVTVATYYLRALGETGDLNGLLQGLDQMEQKFDKRSDNHTLNLVRMFAFAFCGQPEQVARSFKGPLASCPPNTQQFWLATAELAAGNEAIAREQLAALRDRSDPILQKAIDWRLSQPLTTDAQALMDSRKQLAAVRVTLQHEARYNDRSAFQRKNAYATYSLIVVNLLVFGLEIAAGGSENLATLYALGGMVPVNVFEGEWWRLFTAIFLHYGPLHLALNMFGLYYFGTLAEAKLGSAKFLLAYGFSGIGSMLASAMMSIANAADQISVGASGAIMGMVGVMGAFYLWGWRRDRAKNAVKQLWLILSIAGLQFLSDLVTPNVSLSGHSSGFVLGFLAGGVLFAFSRATVNTD